MNVFVSISFFCLGFFCANAQKHLDMYSATNGVTYHNGDTLKVGRGSMPDGSFKYFQLGGFSAVMTHNHGENASNLPKRFSGYNLIIKKIRNSNVNGGQRVEFTLTGAGPGSFIAYVEDAIATCEIVPCSNQSVSTSVPQEDKYDKLKKLKSLLDSGAITQKEYDEQKQKLLNQQ